MTRSDPALSELCIVSLCEIAQSSGFSADEVRELVELGAFETDPQGPDMFAAGSVAAARLARRLQLDFELPLAGVALVLAYRERIRELEQRVRRLECQSLGAGNAAFECK